MSRKAFKTPCLMMLVLALISFLIDLTTLRYARRAGTGPEPGWWLFKFSLLYIVEAIVYWIIRYRMTDARNVWTHIFVLLIGVYTLPFVNFFSGAG